MDIRYKVVLERDEDSGWYTVTVPDLPGCITQGKDIEDALKNAKEAIELYLEDEDPIPLPKRLEEVVRVHV